MNWSLVKGLALSPPPPPRKSSLLWVGGAVDSGRPGVKVYRNSGNFGARGYLTLGHIQFPAHVV